MSTSVAISLLALKTNEWWPFVAYISAAPVWAFNPVNGNCYIQRHPLHCYWSAPTLQAICIRSLVSTTTPLEVPEKCQVLFCSCNRTGQGLDRNCLFLLSYYYVILVFSFSWCDPNILCSGFIEACWCCCVGREGGRECCAWLIFVMLLQHIVTSEFAMTTLCRSQLTHYWTKKNDLLLSASTWLLNTIKRCSMGHNSSYSQRHQSRAVLGFSSVDRPPTPLSGDNKGLYGDPPLSVHWKWNSVLPVTVSDVTCYG